MITGTATPDYANPPYVEYLSPGSHEVIRIDVPGRVPKFHIGTQIQHRDDPTDVHTITEHCVWVGAFQFRYYRFGCGGHAAMQYVDYAYERTTS